MKKIICILVLGVFLTACNKTDADRIGTASSADEVRYAEICRGLKLSEAECKSETEKMRAQTAKMNKAFERQNDIEKARAEKKP